jgi:hypothetical protein
MNATQTQIGDLNELECSARLASTCQDADVHPIFPMDTAEVVEVLRSGGAYDVTTVLLDSWARSQSVGRVSVHSGKFSWSAGNILAAAGLANASRLWLLDAKHISKMSAAELADLQCRRIGESLFTDLDDCDIRSLIGVISGCNDSEQRSVLCLGLTAKLRKDSVIS